MPRRLYNTGFNLSRMLNVLILNGHRDESMSMNCGRIIKYTDFYSRKRVIFMRFLATILNVFDENHCKKAYESSEFYHSDRHAIENGGIFPAYKA